MAEAGNLKLDFMSKSIGIQFFGLNTFLDVIEITKQQKPCWPHRHFKGSIIWTCGVGPVITFIYLSVVFISFAKKVAIDFC